MKSLKNKHLGQTVWIVGKGPSLQYLKKEDIGDGIVITINQAILAVEPLDLSNSIYSLQKDGGGRRIGRVSPPQDNHLLPDCDHSDDCGDTCGPMVRPRSATLLLHELESKYCFQDYADRYVINLQEIGLQENVFSLIFALKIAQYMGCNKFNFVSCDAHSMGEHSRYVPGEGITKLHNQYLEQINGLKPFLKNINYKFITPSIKISFGVLVNDIMRLDMVFRQSEIEGSANTIKMPDAACKGLNKLIKIMENDGSDIAVLSHQDMYYREGWIDQARQQISLLPDSWVVAGIIGKDMNGNICGRIHDMRIPLHFSTSHTFPHPASCFDECCIIINLKKGFRFDEGLGGFDLYGTLCVLQAKEMGGTAWIIDAFAEHYCMRSFEWYPGKDFEDSYKWIHKRFPDADRIDSTVIGVEEVKQKQVA